MTIQDLLEGNFRIELIGASYDEKCKIFNFFNKSTPKRISDEALKDRLSNAIHTTRIYIGPNGYAYGISLNSVQYFTNKYIEVSYKTVLSLIGSNSEPKSQDSIITFPTKQTFKNILWKE